MPTERIIITRQIPGLAEAVKELPAEWETWISPSDTKMDKEELMQRAATATGLLVIGDRVDREVLEGAPNLRVVSNYGVGVDNIDLAVAKEKGVAVTNLPNEVTYATAELAMALLLACARRVREADAYIRKTNPFQSSPTSFMGTSLKGKILGLIGFGRIAQKTAQMAKAFDMNVIYHARTRRPEAEATIGATYRELSDLLGECDVLSLHIPGGKETHHYIGREELSLLRPGAILVNTARGTVVDEDALVDALSQGRLHAAGLDVFEQEPLVHEGLLGLDNVVLTPHIGTSSLDTRVEMTQSAIRNLKAVLLGKEPGHRVV